MLRVPLLQALVLGLLEVVPEALSEGEPVTLGLRVMLGQDEGLRVAVASTPLPVTVALLLRATLLLGA